MEPGPEASVRKALADEHGQHDMAAAIDLAGPDALLQPWPVRWPTSEWADGYLYSRALTIGGGTSEVQRNIIGERVLGLPTRTRGRRMSFRIPPNDVFLGWLRRSGNTHR